MVNHEALIDGLTGSLMPVRRPLPAPWRALGWMALALPCGVLATRLIATYTPDWSAPGMAWAMVEIALSLALGAAATVLAFESSIAGRPLIAGRRVLLALGLAWLGVCVGNMLHTPQTVFYRSGAGMYCYTFMMLASAPMMPLAIVALRRTRAIRPWRSLLVAGTGIAFLDAGLLGFCHTGKLHAADFLMHLAAGISIVVLTAVLGRRFIAA